MFAGMREWPGTLWFMSSIPLARRAIACSLIALASCGPGHSSRGAVSLMAACKSLNTATVVTPCARSASALQSDFHSTTPIVQISMSKTSIRPVPSYLRKTSQPSQFEQTAAPPALPSSVWYPSVYYVQEPDPAFLFFLFAHSSMALLAAASPSSIVVLTACSSSGSGQHIVFALLPRVCCIAPTLPTRAPGVG